MNIFDVMKKIAEVMKKLENVEIDLRNLVNRNEKEITVKWCHIANMLLDIQESIDELHQTQINILELIRSGKIKTN